MKPHRRRIWWRVPHRTPVGMAAAEEADADVGFTERGGYSLVHRTVFVYDSLMADECLHALLQPGSRRIGKRPGYIGRHKRLAVRDAPWLAAAVATDDASDRCDGVLLERLQPSELRAIDSFMDDRLDRLMVGITAEDGVGGQTQVEALMYVCPEDSASTLLDGGRQWSYATFRTTHLEKVAAVCGACREHFLADEAKEKAASERGGE